jgi:hypothetical protein
MKGRELPDEVRGISFSRTLLIHGASHYRCKEQYLKLKEKEARKKRKKGKYEVKQRNKKKVFRNAIKKNHSFARLSAGIKFCIKCKYVSQLGGTANTAVRH